MDIWDASSIQLVWFSQQVPTSAVRDLFVSIFDEEPDDIRNNRSPTPAAPFLSMAGGAVSAGQAQVTISPGRVDVVLTPPLSDAGDIFHIEDTVGVLDQLIARTPAVGKVLTEVYRVALVVTVLSPPVKDLSEASALINERIGKVISFEDALDLQFQVNRRMTAKTGSSITLNRLVRFAVAITQQFLIGAFTLGQQVPATGRPTSESIGASLAIDLNNVPTGNTLQSDVIEALWREYQSEALRIREIGSVGALAS